VIEWGDGSDTEEKCKRLKRFYEAVISTEGLDRYERIKVQFKGQVVGVRREEKETNQDQLSASRKIKDVIAELQNQHQLEAEKATLSVIEDAIQQGTNEKTKTGGSVKKQ
jgi:cell division protein FtsQ